MAGTTADWDSRYAATTKLFGDSPSPLLLEHRDLLRPGMEALAIGDGEGRNGVWLAAQGLHVLSVDLSPRALARARARAEGLQVELATLCVDVVEWGWPRAAFDLVACIFVHFPPATRPRVHRAIIDALKPGGLLMLEAFHRDQAARGTGGPSDPDMLYTLHELEESFADCLILSLEQTETDVEVDGRCSGRGAVVHLLARK
jgi:SAM-dependent methyltransferase